MTRVPSLRSALYSSLAATIALLTTSCGQVIGVEDTTLDTIQLPQNFRKCYGTYKDPVPADGVTKIKIKARVTVSGTTNPAPMIDVRACTDPNCAVPVPGTTDADGAVEVEVPIEPTANNPKPGFQGTVTFSGKITTAEGEKVMRTLIFAFPTPQVEDINLNDVFALTDAAWKAGQKGAGFRDEPSLTHGSVFFAFLDCDGKPSPDVTFSLKTTDDKTTPPVAFTNGQWDVGAEGYTTAFGAAAIFNVGKGQNLATVTPRGAKVPVAQVLFEVEPGANTTMFVTPNL